MIAANLPVRIGEDAPRGIELTIEEDQLFWWYPDEERAGTAGEYLHRGKEAAHAGDGVFFEFVSALDVRDTGPLRD